MRAEVRHPDELLACAGRLMSGPAERGEGWTAVARAVAFLPLLSRADRPRPGLAIRWRQAMVAAKRSGTADDLRLPMTPGNQ